MLTWNHRQAIDWYQFRWPWPWPGWPLRWISSLQYFLKSNKSKPVQDRALVTI